MDGLKLGDHHLGDAVHAADRWDDEEIVSDAYLSVTAAIPVKREGAFRIGYGM
ncbi:hypothetical protein D3C76_1754690 [compost metagenome]